jgi:hypothetical protein
MIKTITQELTVNVAQDFFPRLTNRDKNQGDGKHTAEEFRRKYLKQLDNGEAWLNDEPFIILDFKDIIKIGPSFANEAFAYFTQYAKPELILKKILFENITNVKLLIIKQELETGYNQ